MKREKKKKKQVEQERHLDKDDAWHICASHGEVATINGGDGPVCGVCNGDEYAIELHRKMNSR